MTDELDIVILLRDLPQKGLKAGTIGCAVMAFAGGEAFDVEFFDDEGETIALATLPSSAIRLARPEELPFQHARVA